MRIALFSWETLHSIPVGGVGVHVTELAAALERRKHEVHVFTRRAHNQLAYENIHGVHYHRCDFQMHSNFIEEINNMCRSFVSNFFEVETVTGKFDIVHAHDWLAANAVVWIKHGRGHASVLSMHSTEYGRNGNRFYAGNAVRVQEHERYGTHVADKVITVSNQLRDEIRWLYNVPDSKSKVIYNGVTTKQFDNKIDAGEIKKQYAIGPLDPTILFVGRMVVQKGPDILMRAIPSILRHYGNAKFVFVGDGHMKNEVITIAHQLKVAHAIRMLGAKSGLEVINLFQACDVLCVPSRNEPFGIVILEGWSASKPVVSTKRGGPAEFVWHGVTGLHVDDTPDSVAWGLGTLLSDFQHCEWMGRNGRAAVDAAFSWDRIAEQTEEVYSELS
jgi:glycosyltransferase involved in cell wall biosynthesis